MPTAKSQRQLFQLLLLLTVAGTLTAGSGCINLAANLLHAIHGNNRPAEFSGLEGKRVAVVVASDNGLGSDATTALLSSYIQADLNSNVEKIDVIRQEEVEQWLDVHGWTDSDYVEIGTGVKADCVLAVDIMNMSLKNGATLYRGLCDITVSVYDIKSGGKILYRKQIPEFAFRHGNIGSQIPWSLPGIGSSKGLGLVL